MQAFDPFLLVVELLVATKERQKAEAGLFAHIDGYAATFRESLAYDAHAEIFRQAWRTDVS